MEKLEHPNITKYIESFILENEMFIAVEQTEKGDLKNYISKIREQEQFIPEIIIW